MAVCSGHIAQRRLQRLLLAAATARSLHLTKTTVTASQRSHFRPKVSLVSQPGIIQAA